MAITSELRTRIDYHGGPKADDRMIRDKLKTLKKALLYSYQAETLRLEDGREFRCLINPDKETGNYDNKILSIPYKNICLNEKPGENGTTSQAEQETGLKCGDVFTWVETDTHWICFLEYLEENAYFRTQIRRCDQTTIINGKEYWVYIRGPVETSIPWNQKAGVEWNDMNHSLEMYVTKDENTIDWFKRFKRIKVKEEVTNVERSWQIVACNPYYGDGIVKVSLDEYFENTIEEQVAQEKQEQESDSNQAAPLTPYIKGPREIAPFDKIQFTAENFIGGGTWRINFDNKEVKEIKDDNKSIILSVTKLKGNLKLTYTDAFDTASIDIVIKAF